MARLTLSFKGQKLKQYGLESSETLIGRDPECDIFIDSLALAPRHARIRRDGDGFTIEPFDNDTPLSINQSPAKDATPLADGDTIQVGKHTLSYHSDPLASRGDTEDNSATDATAPSDIHGWLQIQSGSHLGRTIRLNKAFTRIGNADSHLAVIARRSDGHYLSHLSGENAPRVNDRNIGDTSHRLDNGDRVQVGELLVQFFTDATLTAAGDSDMTDTREQRRFRRIPFDVSITLRKGEQCWQGKLVDISLHGALIRTPDGFEAVADSPYQLEIHLEGGPDILMDVHVAHQEAGNTGLRCDDIDVDSITHLRRLVELNLGDEELLERELSALGEAEPV